jgi:N-acetylglucosamine kinase-like BadF-type ATPase
MTRIFLGIDGGQSSTTCFLGDESGRVVGVGRAGPSNHVGAELGRERFLAAIGESLRAALDAAGVGRRTKFAAACLGMSGGPEDKEALARKLIPADLYLVTHDAAIALTGATGGGPGIVTIGGTGSMAFGRNAAGKTARAGGWGYVFGDEGGAFHVVRQALRAALRYEEGWGSARVLRDSLLAASGAPSANDLLHRFYTDRYPRERVAGFAPTVDEAARAGDEAALAILRAAGDALAMFTAAVRKQLFAEREVVDVRWSGGVFYSTPVLARYEVLVGLDGACQVSGPAMVPAAGALIEAYKLAGVECTLKDVPEE